MQSHAEIDIARHSSPRTSLVGDSSVAVSTTPHMT